MTIMTRTKTNVPRPIKVPKAVNIQLRNFSRTEADNIIRELIVPMTRNANGVQVSITNANDSVPNVKAPGSSIIQVNLISFENLFEEKKVFVDVAGLIVSKVQKLVDEGLSPDILISCPQMQVNRHYNLF